MYCSSGDITHSLRTGGPTVEAPKFYDAAAAQRRSASGVPQLSPVLAERVPGIPPKRPKWGENPHLQPPECKNCPNHLPRSVGVRLPGRPRYAAKLGEGAEVVVRGHDPDTEAVAAGRVAGEGPGVAVEVLVSTPAPRRRFVQADEVHGDDRLRL